MPYFYQLEWPPIHPTNIRWRPHDSAAFLTPPYPRLSILPHLPPSMSALFHAKCALMLPHGSPTSSSGLLPPPSLRPSDDSSPARRGHQEGMSGAASWSHGRNRGPPGARLRHAAASQGGAHGRFQLSPVAGSAVAWSNPGRSTSADLFGNPTPAPAPASPSTRSSSHY